MKRLARITLCASLGLGIMAPAAAAQTYVGGEAPVVQADNGAVLSGGGVADTAGETSGAAAGDDGQLLAFTGFALAGMILLGGGLVGVGALLRRAAGDVPAEA